MGVKKLSSVKDLYAPDFIKRSSNIIFRGNAARAYVCRNAS